MSNDAMVQVYVKLVQAGRRTLESVPDNLRDLVEQALNESME